MSHSLRPHGLQHARLPCPSLFPRVCSKLMSIESVMPSNHLILCCPFVLPPSTFPSIRVFSNESVLCIRWPKYWSFSFSISPSRRLRDLHRCPGHKLLQRGQLLFSHLQSFQASGTFAMSQFFASGGQSIGVSPSASVLPMTIQD